MNDIVFISWQPITLISSFFLLVGLYCVRHKIKNNFDIFLISITTIYQPLYSLLSVGYINLSFVVSSSLIFFMRNKILNMHIVLVSILLSLSGINYLYGNIDLTELMKSILFLTILFSGLIAGNYLANKKSSKIFFSCLAISYSILSLMSLVMKYFFYDLIEIYGLGRLRDNGYNPSVLIPLIFYLIFSIKLYKKYTLFGFLYLLVISSRTSIIQTFVLVVKYSKKIKESNLLLVIFTILSLIICFIFFQRTFLIEKIDQLSFIGSSTLTRQMAVFMEINKFSESPLIGQGFFYYSDQFLEMWENTLMRTSEFSYAAFNHIGIISTLAQGGIIGFLILIIFPFYIFLNFTWESFEDRLIKEIYFLNFISFFISGSPIVLDFHLSFFYYLTVGYMYSICKRKNKLFRLT